MNKKGYFGEFGGIFIPETLEYPLRKLKEAYFKYSRSSSFKEELNYYLRNYAGRPTPLYFAENLSKKLNLRVYLKREDLLHTGAHKMNNALGQGLLAIKMGKEYVDEVAENAHDVVHKKHMHKHRADELIKIITEFVEHGRILNRWTYDET